MTETSVLPPARRAEDCPTAWFAVLERALEDGDVPRAAHAVAELERLGVTVQFRRRPAEAAR
jgi:hypothetical protein